MSIKDFIQSDFKLIVNSDKYYGSKTNNDSINYLFDFSNVDDGLYELTFTFAGESQNEEFAGPAELKIDFFDSKTYVVNPTTTCLSTTTHIGLLYPDIISTTGGYLYAKASDNPPTIIRKPQGNLFNVSILNVAGTSYLDGSGNPVAKYLLALNFHKVANN